mgnify:CR=1 FL=1|jgi:ABC-type bacteriocin/lantibiotic exporter with double-glycine peptidase domain|tara:strand:- start:47 stop:163 length:117 start_codon:yes stop_codon:yes gene_type:complete
MVAHRLAAVKNHDIITIIKISEIISLGSNDELSKSNLK